MTKDGISLYLLSILIISKKDRIIKQNVALLIDYVQVLFRPNTETVMDSKYQSIRKQVTLEPRGYCIYLTIQMFLAALQSGKI